MNAVAFKIAAMCSNLKLLHQEKIWEFICCCDNPRHPNTKQPLRAWSKQAWSLFFVCQISIHKNVSFGAQTSRPHMVSFCSQRALLHPGLDNCLASGEERDTGWITISAPQFKPDASQLWVWSAPSFMSRWFQHPVLSLQATHIELFAKSAYSMNPTTSSRIRKHVGHTLDATRISVQWRFQCSVVRSHCEISMMLGLCNFDVETPLADECNFLDYVWT